MRESERERERERERIMRTTNNQALFIHLHGLFIYAYLSEKYEKYFYLLYS